MHVDKYFRVFRNDTTPFIDPKQPQEDLTELVEIEDGRAFILHPGEFVLGSTYERVALPDDMVARLEGKSSLGRLGLLIHSSLPGSEPVALLRAGHLEWVAIGDIVQKRLAGSVVSFDPESFAVSFHEITGWYEGPADRIFEIVLASGRAVRVTAGHNLFTLDRDGALSKVRTAQLEVGARVAIPRRVPRVDEAAPTIDVLSHAPESAFPWLSIGGPTVAWWFEQVGPEISEVLRTHGFKHDDFYRSRSRLPLLVALQFDGLVDSLTDRDEIVAKG